MDLGVQAADAVGDLVDLAGQVQIEAGEHAQRGGVLVAGRDRPQRVRHGAGRASDHGCVALVRLGRPGRQVGDAPHRQARQVAHSDAHVLGHRHCQGPDSGGLVDDHQQPAVLAEMLVDLAQAGLVIGQRPVVQALARRGQGGRPVLALANIDTDEDVDVVHLHDRLLSFGACGASPRRAVPHPRMR